VTGESSRSRWRTVAVLSLAVMMVSAAYGPLTAGSALAAADADQSTPGRSAVESVPSVDFSDPPAEVVADASDQFRHRDHAWSLWIWTENRTTGERSGGVFTRFRVDRERNRFRATAWPRPGDGDNLVTPADPPTRRLFSSRYFTWIQRSGEGEWELLTVPGKYLQSFPGPGFPTEELRNASVTVVSENESALVVRTRDRDVVDALNVRSENTTATFVVAKTADPYLARVTTRHVEPDEVEVASIRVEDVGNVDVRFPENTERVTPLELLNALVVP